LSFQALHVQVKLVEDIFQKTVLRVSFGGLDLYDIRANFSPKVSNPNIYINHPETITLLNNRLVNKNSF